MKSASYWTRKAEALRECGHWHAADDCATRAAKARRIAKRKKQKGGK